MEAHHDDNEDDEDDDDDDGVKFNDSPCGAGVDGMSTGDEDGVQEQYVWPTVWRHNLRGSSRVVL